MNIDVIEVVVVDNVEQNQKTQIIEDDVYEVVVISNSEVIILILDEIDKVIQETYKPNFLVSDVYVYEVYKEVENEI